MESNEKTKNDLIRQIICFILIIGASIAANILGMAFGETDTGEVANSLFSDNVYFFPATYVFITIWPVIYLGLMGLAVHQLLPSQAVNPRYRKGMYMLSVNLVLNALWVFVFGRQMFSLSLIIILPILVSAVWSYFLLEIPGYSKKGAGAEKVLTVSVSIYTAWLTVATIANVSLVLAHAGWNGFGLSYELWTVIILLVGLALGFLLTLRLRDPYFALVYAYAYLGISVRRFPEFSDLQAIVLVSLIGAAAFLVLAVISFVRFSKQSR